MESMFRSLYPLAICRMPMSLMVLFQAVHFHQKSNQQNDLHTDNQHSEHSDCNANPLLTFYTPIDFQSLYSLSAPVLSLSKFDIQTLLESVPLS